MPQGKSSAKVGAFQLDEGWVDSGSDGGARGRGSEIDKLLEQIRSDTRYHGSEIGIAVYQKAETAKGAMHSLRTRLGPVEASGFTFRVKFHKAKGMYAVAATYTPGDVTEEGKTAHVKATVDRKAKEKAAREKKAAEAKAKEAETQPQVNEQVAA